MKIGVGVTTTPNRSFFEFTIQQWKKYLPKGAELLSHDDELFEGISVSKNRLLERLAELGCDHIFLADDDTYPTTEGWWRPYVESKEPHLQYNFAKAPSHWDLKEVYRDNELVAYDKSRGCMLYVDARILPVVGGMHNAFGKHGREHEDWSERIHRAGLTTHPFQDVVGSDRLFYCRDQNEAGISSVEFSKHQGWRKVDTTRLPLFADYTSNGVPALVARRNDHGHRDRIWRFLKRKFWGETVDMPVFEGHHVEGAFNRSLGLNLAAELAGNWDVAVFIDSDAYIDPDRLGVAVKLARDEQKMVAPFTRVVELSEETTEKVLQGSIGMPLVADGSQIDRTREDWSSTQSLILVVPRNLFEVVRGFDERFKGWGQEDNAFWKSMELAGGKVLRLPGDVFHLWHKKARPDGQLPNARLWHQYARLNSLEELWRIRNS